MIVSNHFIVFMILDKIIEKWAKASFLQVRELKRTHSQQLMTVQQEQFKDELDLYCRYHDPLYVALEQVMGHLHIYVYLSGRVCPSVCPSLLGSVSCHEDEVALKVSCYDNKPLRKIHTLVK